MREAGLSDWSALGFSLNSRGTSLSRLDGAKQGRGRRDTGGLAGKDCTSRAAGYRAAFKEEAPIAQVVSRK